MGHQQAARTRPRPARADRGGTAQEAGRRGTRGPVREKGLRSTQARSRRAAPPEESSPGGPEKDAPRSGTPDRPAGGSLAQSGPDQVLLETIAGIGLPTDPDEALRLAVAGAMTVTGARYGALGLIGEGGRLAGFIPVGMSKAQIARLPRWPEGRGLLGELTRNPRPIRLADLSAHPAAEGFPARHPRMHSLLAAPVLIRDEMFGTIFLADKRWPDADAAGRRGSGRYGAAFDASDEAALVAVAGAAGLAVENARLRADARRRDRWQQATAEVTHRLLSASDPREVLGLLVQHALEISGADAVALAEPDASGDYISVTHAAGSGTEGLVGVVIPAEQSLTAVVLKSGQAMRVDEYSTDPRIAPAAKRVTKLGPAVVVDYGS